MNVNGKEVKGLRADIYKSGGKSWDAGRGISHDHEQVTIIPSADFPLLDGQVFPVTDEAPAVVIVKRNIRLGGKYGDSYLTAYPADKDGNPDTDGRMHGGCYIETSDSRFPGAYPIPLHDRKEW